MKSALEINRVASLTGHTGSVYALETSGTGHTFYSGAGDKLVAEWDLTLPEMGQPVARALDIIYSLALIRERNYLLIGQSQGGIHVINLNDQKETRLLQYHQAPIFDLAISTQHQLLFSLAGDGTLGVSDLETLNLIKILQEGDGKLRSAALSNDANFLAIGTAAGTITLFRLPEMQRIKSWQAHQQGFSVNSVVFSPDDNFILSGSRDAHLNVFDFKNDCDLKMSIPAHNYAIYSIVYHPEKKMFATGSRDKSIKIWDAENFQVLAKIDKDRMNGHINSVNKLLWHHETKKLISCSDDRSIMVWNVE